MIGKTISHYKILKKLGEGGMGVVYKAEDTELKREVAIKFLPQHIAASEAERKRFKVEAQAAASLNHPNIATIYAIEKTEDETFIAMEYSVAIKGPFCLDIEGPLSAGISNPTDADLKSNFFNFPNPFGSRPRPITSFHYYLQKDSDIIVRIYTLLGELVWSRRYSATDAQGSAGMHDGFQQPTVVWDGTNTKKQRVLNGVYVAVLKTNTEKAMTKIAVAK